MKNINIKDLKIDIDLLTLLNAVDSKKSFDIDIDGNIHFDETIPQNIVSIFRTSSVKTSNLLDINTKIKNLFGSDYKPKIDASICNITPLPSWMKIIDLNKENMLYFDHQSDGVEYFEEKVIEDIGWNAVVFDIKYRDISDFIENNCSGTFVFYDNGMHFNGFVIVDDIKEVENKLTDFIKNLIIKKIKNNELNINDLDEDELESLEFFKIK